MDNIVLVTLSRNSYWVSESYLGWRGYSPPSGSTLRVWSSFIHLSMVSSSMLNGLSLYCQPGVNVIKLGF